jgi:hypothetical protein
MSIINEALKKASEKSGKLDFEEKNKILSNQHRKRKINWGPVLIVLTFLFVSGPIVGPIVSGIFHSNRVMPKVSAGQEILPLENPKAQFELEEAPLPMAPSPVVLPPALDVSQFKLSGIVYSAEGSYCLINGQVLKAGDRIGKVKVVDVSPRWVTLESEDQTFKISL